MSRSETKAVALKYNAEEDIAPVVIASGYGDVAERIIDIAEQRGIPVFRDDSAASMMCMLEVGSSIPQELYQVVAAIYVHLLSISTGKTPTPPVAPPEAIESIPDPGQENRQEDGL